MFGLSSLAIRILGPLAIAAGLWLHGCYHGKSGAEEAFDLEKREAAVTLFEENELKRAEHERNAKEINERIRKAEGEASDARKSLQQRIADAKRSNATLVTCVAGQPGGGARPLLTHGAVRMYDDAVRAAQLGKAAAPSARRTEAPATDPSTVGIADLLTVNEENMASTGTCYRRVQGWEAWAKREGLWK